MRWRELQLHVGVAAKLMAMSLGIEPKRWSMMVLGIDAGEELLTTAATSFRVTECWLRGHTTELPDVLVTKLSDHAATGDVATGDARIIAETCAAWATCADCRTASEASP